MEWIIPAIRCGWRVWDRCCRRRPSKSFEVRFYCFDIAEEHETVLHEFTWISQLAGFPEPAERFWVVEYILEDRVVAQTFDRKIDIEVQEEEPPRRSERIPYLDIQESPPLARQRLDEFLQSYRVAGNVLTRRRIEALVGRKLDEIRILDAQFEEKVLGSDDLIRF